MSDGLIDVMNRISQIRTSFGRGSGGTLGVKGDQGGFEQALRAASGSASRRPSGSARRTDDPLDRLAVPGGTRAAARRGDATSSSWPAGAPDDAEPYAEDFEAASRETGVPVEILIAVAWAESGFDPGAQSPAGAEGMMQLMPGTAAGLGVDPSDPAQNILGGARYLAAQYDRFGSWDLALAAYNAGPGAVEQYGGVPPYRETQGYIDAVRGYLDRMTAASPTPAAGGLGRQALVGMTPVAAGDAAAVAPTVDTAAAATDVSARLPEPAATTPAPVPVGASVEPTPPADPSGPAAAAASTGPDLADPAVVVSPAVRGGSADPGPTTTDTADTVDTVRPGTPAGPTGATAAPVATGIQSGQAGQPGQNGPGNQNGQAAAESARAAAAAASATASTSSTAAAPAQGTASVPSGLPMTPAAFPQHLLGQVQRSGPGSHRLEIRLDPPELGPVEVTFQLRGDQVHVVVRPERAEGGALLFQQRERIAELLAREGLQLSRFDVGTGSSGSGSRGYQPTPTTRGYSAVDLDLTTDTPLTADRELRL